MNRRESFRRLTTGLLGVGILDYLGSAQTESALAATAAPASSRVLSLTGVKENSELVAAAYRAKQQGKALEGSKLPYVYAYYDENLKKFVSPLDINCSASPGQFTLNSTLHAFNITTSLQDRFKKLKNQVQLGFNATAPVTNADQLTWVFMNAVDVFLAKPSDQSQQLTKFTNGSSDGTILQANPKVSVPKGTVNLQVTAFGQRKDGIWKTLFDLITKVAQSPIISTASKGFGIPALATEALQFVDHVIGVYTQQEKLVPLWQTASLEFAVHKEAHARFKLNAGLWTTIDSDYAQASNFLEGHTLDLKFNSFLILDKNGKRVDANYLVTDLKLDPA